MDRIRDILALVVILGILGASLAGIYFLQKGIDVQIFNPEQRSVVRTIEAVGEVKFVENNEVIAPFDGKVLEVFSEIGDIVEEGDPLFSYSVEEWEVQLFQKQIQLKRLDEQIETKKRQLERELIDLEEGKLDWLLREKELEIQIERQMEDQKRLIEDLEKSFAREKEELKYLEELLEEHHVSRREFEEAQAQVKSIESELNRAQQDLERFSEVEVPMKRESIAREGERIEKDIERIKKEISSYYDPNTLNLVEEEKKLLEKNITDLENQISGRTVYAPIDGYLTGSVIEKGQQISSGRIVMRINDPQFLEIVLRVEGKNFHRLEEGLEVEIDLEDVYPPLSGEINWVSSWAEGNTVEVGVRITDRREIIKPGMMVEATINLPGRRVLAIPPHAVFERELPDTRMVIREGEDIGYYVFLVNKDTREVYPHRVRIGQVTEDFVEVISGLSTSSNVVIGDYEALNQLESKLADWERRMIEEIRVNFSDGN